MISRKNGLAVLVMVFVRIVAFSQSTDTLAGTPPMGWNSWNKFGCNVSETLIKEIADAMVSNKMKEVGYEYIVIDDCWQIGRDKDGNIIPDPKLFPSGIKALGDYIHSKGLKFGIYSCAGSQTCQKRPGSKGYQFQDARAYASWGVDFLKYDWCYNDGQNAKAAYLTMGEALKATGRPIVFSICEWGTNKPWEWGKGIGHLWRTTEDIVNSFDGDIYWGGLSVLSIIDLQANLYKYAGPGHWNDPDMLEVGNSILNYTQSKTHFSMWAMMAAPLMAGNDIRKMDKPTAEILTNNEVIAVDQDELGIQGRRFWVFGKHEIWLKELKNGEVAICFLNRDANNAWKLDYDWKHYGLGFITNANLDKNIYKVRDLWLHKDIGNTSVNLVTEIPPQGISMMRLSAIKN
ncbi:MAG: alpha-galactosidase [Ferruginibacter sp.]|nr:alpha-galactosidase [Ferruginibacter sp.]